MTEGAFELILIPERKHVFSSWYRKWIYNAERFVASIPGHLILTWWCFSFYISLLTQGVEYNFEIVARITLYDFY